jgi:hypothetical protein
LPGLKVQCEKHLGEIINPVNVAEILLLSDSYSCQHLKKAALSYCSENHSYIMKDSQWKIMEEEKNLCHVHRVDDLPEVLLALHLQPWQLRRGRFTFNVKEIRFALLKNWSISFEGSEGVNL